MWTPRGHVRAVGQWWVRSALGGTEEARVEAPVDMVIDMAMAIFSGSRWRRTQKGGALFWRVMKVGPNEMR